ncbi:MAG: DUF4159 domain-containing protein [Planctomycetota bacterium]|nr:DUF4159 domain-containing protein [Planctomycetota bacterium]
MLYHSLDTPGRVLLFASICLVPLLAGHLAAPPEPTKADMAAQVRTSDPYPNRRFGGGGPGFRPRAMPTRDEFPQWKNAAGFEQDAFTFVRIQYDSYGPFGWWDRWDNDFPDGDWNFSYRLQQMTSLKVDPNGKVLRFSDPELFRYPFIYLAGVQTMRLSEAERQALRRYLLNGGFMMVDDFWSARAWANLLAEMQQVFPDREPTELDVTHPIFHQVYDLDELPQVVDIKTWSDGYAFEHAHGAAEGDHAPHFWAYHDDRERVVALLCHNNDIGDGWEREGENEAYFRQFSEKQSYPLGINVVTYALTH